MKKLFIISMLLSPLLLFGQNKYFTNITLSETVIFSTGGAEIDNDDADTLTLIETIVQVDGVLNIIDLKSATEPLLYVTSTGNVDTIQTLDIFAGAAAVGGTGDAITIDFIPDYPALSAGAEVMFIAEANNTGATTLTLDGGAAKDVYEASDISALDANDIRDGMVVRLIYDGTQWQQISQSGN